MPVIYRVTYTHIQFEKKLKKHARSFHPHILLFDGVVVGLVFVTAVAFLEVKISRL